MPDDYAPSRGPFTHRYAIQPGNHANGFCRGGIGQWGSADEDLQLALGTSIKRTLPDWYGYLQRNIPVWMSDQQWMTLRVEGENGASIRRSKEIDKQEKVATREISSVINISTTRKLSILRYMGWCAVLMNNDYTVTTQKYQPDGHFTAKIANFNPCKNFLLGVNIYFFF